MLIFVARYRGGNLARTRGASFFFWRGGGSLLTPCTIAYTYSVTGSMGKRQKGKAEEDGWVKPRCSIIPAIHQGRSF